MRKNIEQLIEQWEQSTNGHWEYARYKAGKVPSLDELVKICGYEQIPYSYEYIPIDADYECYVKAEDDSFDPAESPYEEASFIKLLRIESDYYMEVHTGNGREVYPEERAISKELFEMLKKEFIDAQ